MTENIWRTSFLFQRILLDAVCSRWEEEEEDCQEHCGAADIAQTCPRAVKGISIRSKIGSEISLCLCIWGGGHCPLVNLTI